MGIRVKIYYTVRELTNHAPEIPALRSLGTEVIAPGPGGGSRGCRSTWTRTTSPAGSCRRSATRRSINTGVSRWHNFYVEGLDWLVRQRRHRRPVHRRRRVRPHHHEAGAEGARPRPAGAPDRPALGQPVQPPRRVRQQRQPLPRALSVPQPALVRRVLRLQLAAGLLAGRDVRHPVRPDGRDAGGRRQPVARHGLRHDRPPAVGGRPARRSGRSGTPGGSRTPG